MKPFNPNQNHRVLMPEGTYQVFVSHAYERVSRNGNPYISLGLKVTSDINKNRIIFRNYFLEGDPNSYATQRSAEELSQICRASEFTDTLTDPTQLINGNVFTITVEHYMDNHGQLQEVIRV